MQKWVFRIAVIVVLTLVMGTVGLILIVRRGRTTECAELTHTWATAKGAPDVDQRTMSWLMLRDNVQRAEQNDRLRLSRFFGGILGMDDIDPPDVTCPSDALVWAELLDDLQLDDIGIPVFWVTGDAMGVGDPAGAALGALTSGIASPTLRPRLIPLVQGFARLLNGPRHDAALGVLRLLAVDEDGALGVVAALRESIVPNETNKPPVDECGPVESLALVHAPPAEAKAFPMLAAQQDTLRARLKDVNALFYWDVLALLVTHPEWFVATAADAAESWMRSPLIGAPYSQRHMFAMTSPSVRAAQRDALAKEFKPTMTREEAQAWVLHAAVIDACELLAQAARTPEFPDVRCATRRWKDRMHARICKHEDILMVARTERDQWSLTPGATLGTAQELLRVPQGVEDTLRACAMLQVLSLRADTPTAKAALEKAQAENICPAQLEVVATP